MKYFLYFLLVTLPINIFFCWRSWKKKPRSRAREIEDMLEGNLFEQFRKREDKDGGKGDK